MKTVRLLIFFISMVAGGLPLKCLATGLVPEQCSLETRPVVFYPIETIRFTFDGAIQALEGSVATIFMEDNSVATGTISFSNYVGSKRTQGAVDVLFDEPLVLPKGKKYTLVVPKDVIWLQSSPETTNDELRVDFEVPETLGLTDPSIEEGAIISSENRIGFYFGTEIAPINNPEIMLYREGLLVRTYPCDVSWDWDLGYAGVDFGERINFEAGVKYTLKLPEGSVSALHREDITNEEATVNFTGGYTEPVQPIEYVWCSLYDNHPEDILGEVHFYYDQEIALSHDAKLQLVTDDADIVKEVTPTLSTLNGQWVLTADFGNFPLETGKGYSVVIPEGTLVTPDGDVVVNSRNVTDVGNTNGICQTVGKNATLSISKGMLTIKGIEVGAKIKIFSIDGKMVKCATATSESISMCLPDGGIYILSVHGKVYKIIVEKF